MFPNLFNASTIPILQESISFAQSRHEVLAGNIANLDTPGYRIRDLSPEVFQQRLKEMIESKRTSVGHDSPGILQGGADDALRRVREATRSILFHDDSDVGIEQQVLELSNNQFNHNMAIAIMNSQFRLIQTAISERVTA